MTIDHRAARQAARDVTRDHAILHGSGATAAAKFAALERAQKGAETRAALVAAAYLDVLQVLANSRREHGGTCASESACSCGAAAHNARIDAVLGE